MTTWTDLREMAAYEADLAPDDQRVQDGELGVYLRYAMNRLRSIMMREYGDHYFANVTPWPLSVLRGVDRYALPSDFHKLIGLDVFVNNYWIPVQRFAVGERGRYVPPISNATCRMHYVPQMATFVAPVWISIDENIFGTHANEHSTLTVTVDGVTQVLEAVEVGGSVLDPTHIEWEGGSEIPWMDGLLTALQAAFPATTWSMSYVNPYGTTPARVGFSSAGIISDATTMSFIAACVNPLVVDDIELYISATATTSVLNVMTSLPTDMEPWVEFIAVDAACRAMEKDRLDASQKYARLGIITESIKDSVSHRDQTPHLFPDVTSMGSWPWACYNGVPALVYHLMGNKLWVMSSPTMLNPFGVMP
jgi:hypothetical protein